MKKVYIVWKLALGSDYRHVCGVYTSAELARETVKLLDHEAEGAADFWYTPHALDERW